VTAVSSPGGPDVWLSGPMATCNLCHLDVPDDEIEDHRRSVHPEVAADGTGRSDDSTIVADAANQAVRRPHQPEDA
jgi:hypothetical protein